MAPTPRMAKRTETWFVRVFRAFTRLLPFDFRSDYGREIEQVFADQRREARELSRRARIRLSVRALGGLLSTALSEHVAILRRDLRHGARAIRKSPTFAGAIIVTLAIGIGANTAIFSVANGVLLQPLPYESPGRLFRIYASQDGQIPDTGGYYTAPNFVDVRDSGIFDGLVAVLDYRTIGFDLTGNGPPLRVKALPVSSGFLDLLGTAPLIGRGFEPQDEAGATVVMLSEGLWRSRFAAAPDVLGRLIMLDAVPFSVVGVVPRSTVGPTGLDPDVWVPLNLHPGGENFGSNTKRSNANLSVIGRLRAGAGFSGSQEQLDRISARLAVEYEENREGSSGRLVPLHDDLVGDSRPWLGVMLGAAAFLLLIGCANIANLLLVRGASRRTELAMRTALGSNRARLVRQLLTENVVLVIAGGASGLTLAWLGVRTLAAVAPGTLSLADRASFTPSVFAFAAAVTLMTVLLFGIVPAILASRSDLRGIIGSGGSPASTGQSPHGLRSAFVLTQVALALTLVVGAGLLTRSFTQLARLDLGFDTTDGVAFSLNLPDGRYGDPAARIAFYRRFHDRLASHPGIESTGAISMLPVSGLYHMWAFQTPGQEDGSRQGWGLANMRCTDGDYFAAMGIALQAGRVIDGRDRVDSAPVVVVNERFADLHFPDGDAIGSGIRIMSGEAGSATIRTIVGVVADTRQDYFEPAVPKVYIPHSQLADDRNWSLTQVVRSTLPAGAVVGAVNEALAAIDRDLIAYDVRTLDDVARRGIERQRFAMTLVGLFAIVSLVLAATGVYGTVSYAVTCQRREISIRKALGATNGYLWRWTVINGYVPVVAGIGTGLLCAIGLSRYLSSIVFEVSTTDPMTMAGGVVTLALTALAAVSYPAWTASRVEPARILRSE